MDEICGTYAIYRISLVKTCVYVGQSVHIYRRWDEHKKALRSGTHCNQYLQNVWSQYGERSFKFAILRPCRMQDLNDEEQYFIELLKPECNIIRNIFEQFYKKKKRRKKKVSDKPTDERKSNCKALTKGGIC